MHLKYVVYTLRSLYLSIVKIPYHILYSLFRSILPNMREINRINVKCALNNSITKPIYEDICVYTLAKNRLPVMFAEKVSFVKIEW